MTIDIISVIIGAILWELFSGYVKGKKEERERAKTQKVANKTKEEVVEN